MRAAKIALLGFAAVLAVAGTWLHLRGSKVTPDLHERILGALGKRADILLVDMLGPGQHCIFPEGTVVPNGEASRIYKGKHISFASQYNSHDYWFIVQDQAVQVLVVPILKQYVRLRSETIRCGSTLTLAWSESEREF